jgi:predicted nuclease of predicted toxin-antitoxin system
VKFELDENPGPASAAVLREAGFDVVTVSDQRLDGAPDRNVIECCVREERCLVTLDAELGNSLPFPSPPCRGNCSIVADI